MTSAAGNEPDDVLIVGAGIIGLTAGYRLAASGRTVRVLDASGSRGASWVAAGMLAPVSEASYGEENMTRLTLSAVATFRSLAQELETATGDPVGLRSDGTLVVAFNSDDRAALNRLTAFRLGLGLPAAALSGQEVRRLEPYLASGVRSGVLAADDLSIDNRQFLSLIGRAARAAGVHVQAGQVSGLLRGRGTTTGVRTAEGREFHARTVVLCAGAASASLLALPVHPVKGQILRLSVPDRLRTAGEVLTRTVRGLVQGSEVYLVPRRSGEIVVGATSERRGFDVSVTAGGVYELLRNAYELLPLTSEFTFTEALGGSRPGTPDNGPLVGWYDEGLIVATGHYRNGVLLSASTADAVLRLADGKTLAEEWMPFEPRRFDH
jgi:glycine oxidase